MISKFRGWLGIGFFLTSALSGAHAQPSAIETSFLAAVDGARPSGESAINDVYAAWRPTVYAAADACTGDSCSSILYSAMTLAFGIRDYENSARYALRGGSLESNVLEALRWRAIEVSAMVEQSRVSDSPLISLRAAQTSREALAPLWAVVGTDGVRLSAVQWQHVLSMLSQQARAWARGGDHAASAATATLAARLADSRRAELPSLPGVLMADELTRRAAMSQLRAGHVEDAIASLLSIDLFPVKRKDVGFHVLLLHDEMTTMDGLAPSVIDGFTRQWLLVRTWDRRTPQLVLRMAARALVTPSTNSQRAYELVREVLMQHSSLVVAADSVALAEKGLAVVPVGTPAWDVSPVSFGLMQAHMELALEQGRDAEAREAATNILGRFGYDHPASATCNKLLNR